MIQLSTIDLWHLCREIKTDILDSKLDQIYQYDTQTLLLRFHKTGTGKKEIHIHVPRALFQTAKKPPVARHLSFCSYLRKTIKGSRLTDIGLLGFSRTVYFTFTFKDQSYTLICEFYDKGNIMLCSVNESGEYVIDLPSQMQQWTSRTIKKGELYDAENIPFPHELSQEVFEGRISEATTENLTPSKFFATKYKLGGFYSKYICQKLDITDENTLSDLSFEKTQQALATLFSEDVAEYQPRAYVAKEGDIKTATHVAPIDVLNQKSFVTGKTLSEILDAYYAEEQTAEYEDGKTRAFDAKVQKLTRILKAQKKSHKKLQTQVERHEKSAKALQDRSYEIDLVIQDYKQQKKNDLIISEDKKLKTVTVDI